MRRSKEHHVVSLCPVYFHKMLIDSYKGIGLVITFHTAVGTATSPLHLYHCRTTMSSDPTEYFTLPSPATHGLGYLIVPNPHDAMFRSVGRHHIVSFFPESYINDIETTVICMWLGPG